MTLHYFSSKEFCNSYIAEVNGIKNVLPNKYISNTSLTLMFLDIVRYCIGEPIYINSGYRSVALNRKVGGARNSYHTLGLAADIRGAIDCNQIRDFIENHTLDDISIRSLLKEYICYPTFVHIAIDTEKINYIYKLHDYCFGDSLPL